VLAHTQTWPFRLIAWYLMSRPSISRTRSVHAFLHRNPCFMIRPFRLVSLMSSDSSVGPLRLDFLRPTDDCLGISWPFPLMIVFVHRDRATNALQTCYSVTEFNTTFAQSQGKGDCIGVGREQEEGGRGQSVVNNALTSIETGHRHHVTVPPPPTCSVSVLLPTAVLLLQLRQTKAPMKETDGFVRDR
jgi:hypothetical protein